MWILGVYCLDMMIDGCVNVDFGFRMAFCLIVFGLKIWVLLNVLDGIYVCICV